MSDLVQFDKLQAEVTIFVEPLKDLTVRNLQENAVAAGSLKTVKEFSKQVEQRRLELTAPLREQINQINEYAKKITHPLENAEKIIKVQMSGFADQERARAQEEARKLAEAQKIEADKVAKEKARIDAEIKAKRDAEIAELEAKQKAERQKIKEEQEALEAFGADSKGDQKKAEKELEAKQKAEKLATEKRAEHARLENEARLKREQEERERAAKAQLRATEAARPKNTREVWKFEVVAPIVVPKQYLKVDEVAIGNAVRSGIRDIPGVRIFSETLVVSR